MAGAASCGEAPPATTRTTTPSTRCWSARATACCACATTTRPAALAVPRLPDSGRWSRVIRRWYGLADGWDKTYSFDYRPVTGRYSVVHLPFHCDQTGGFVVVKVFTLGEEDAAWRDVAIPGGASCCVDAGIVSVDGKTCWVTKGAETVMAFDLEDETVSSTGPLPVSVGQGGYIFYLTEVSGRLGLAVSADKPTPAKTEVRARVSMLQLPQPGKNLCHVSDVMSRAGVGSRGREGRAAVGAVVQRAGARRAAAAGAAALRARQVRPDHRR